MTDLLHDVLLWTGIALAVLASLVVAPDVPGRLLERVLDRLRPRPQSVTNFVTTAVGTGWATGGSVYVDGWSPTDPVNRQLEVIHGQVVELRTLLRDREKAIFEVVDRQIGRLTNNLDEVRSNLQKLESTVRVSEERSSLLAARALVPVLFGILLSGAPEELSHVPVIGVPLAIGGVVLVVKCVVDLVKYCLETRRQRRATAASVSAAAS